MGIIVQELRERKASAIKKYFAELVHLNNEFISLEVVYQSLRGNVIYEAVKCVNKKTGEEVVYANITKFYFEKGKIYHKRMDESMHPYYYDAPMRLINMLTPTKTEHASEWRNEVIKRHKNKKSANKI